MTEEKRFDDWNTEKQRLHQMGRVPAIHTGEIWWCAVGENVGVEINGKGNVFVLPVLILKKLSRFGFTGIPLTSQPHDGPWYAHFYFKGKSEYAVFAQMRTFSVKRLYRKLGEADDEDMKIIRTRLHNFLFQ